MSLHLFIQIRFQREDCLRDQLIGYITAIYLDKTLNKLRYTKLNSLIKLDLTIFRGMSINNHQVNNLKLSHGKIESQDSQSKRIIKLELAKIILNSYQSTSRLKT